MRPISGKGRVIRAEYTIEELDGQATLVLESRSGGGRNPDYHKALLVLLERLAAMGATLQNGIVDSTVSRSRPFDERILRLQGRPYPIALGEVDDMEALRIALGAAQVPVAQESGARGGNRTKRIRLYLGGVDADGLETRLAAGGKESDDVKEARDRLEAIANPRRAKGQGRGLSAEKRRAVELRAMAVVEDLLKEEDWDVDDVSTKYLGYDIRATRGSEERHVEVKGTTGNGDSVLLTKGEVRHANEHKEHAVLAVVREIQLVRDKDSWSAVGGECRILEPWQLHAGVLEPVGYEWVTPPHPSN
jgi:hypothetical protein